MESVTLASLGTYLFFEEVDANSIKPLCEFLIKANIVLPNDQALTVFINSPGGSLYDGFAVVDLMEISRLSVQTVTVGFVGSMGSIIFTAGSPGMRIMSRNSYMMTHQFSDGVEAKYHEFVAQRKHHDELHKRFMQHYLKRSTMSERQIKDVLLSGSDRYLSAQECLQYGLCDSVKDPL